MNAVRYRIMEGSRIVEQQGEYVLAYCLNLERYAMLGMLYEKSKLLKVEIDFDLPEVERYDNFGNESKTGEFAKYCQCLELQRMYSDYNLELYEKAKENGGGYSWKSSSQILCL